MAITIYARCQVPGCNWKSASAAAYKRHFKACELKYWNKRNKGIRSG